MYLGVLTPASLNFIWTPAAASKSSAYRENNVKKKFIQLTRSLKKTVLKNIYFWHLGGNCRSNGF